MHHDQRHCHRGYQRQNFSHAYPSKITDSPAVDPSRVSTLNLLRAKAPGIARPSLVSPWSGSIDQLLLSFPSYGVHTAELAAGYRSVIDAMRPETRFIVVHHESDRATVESWFGERPVEYVPMPDYVDFTDWADRPPDLRGAGAGSPRLGPFGRTRHRPPGRSPGPT